MSTPSTTAQPQKDYHQQHQLSNYHGHLNRLKNNVEKCGLSNTNNNNNNGIAADEISLSNDNSNNSSSCSNKFRSPLIADSCSVAQFNSCGSKSPPETSNVAMLVNSSSNSNNNTSNNNSGTTTGGTTTNGHFHTHHHHQQHIHQHNTSYKGHNQHSINSNNISHNNNNNSNIINNSGGSNMRKSSYSGSDPNNASFSSASVAGSLQDDNMSDQCSLTQAGLEEYNSRSYYDQPVFHHQKQSSYAQSEGYHSYVSSSDSSSATPFLDRLRQESELLSRQSHHWSQNDLSSSSNNVSNPGENNSSESTSSTETLKWLGSMSDVSVASHATSSSAVSGSATSSSQLIVHSSRVRTPKRHNSESVLYMNDDQMSVTSEVNAVSGSTTGGSGQIQPQQHYPQHPQYHLKGTPDLQNSSSVNSSVAQSPSSPSSTPASSGLVTTTSSPTSSSNASYRSNHRLFAVSTYVEPVNGSSDYQSQQHHHQYQQQQHQQKQSSLAQPQQPQHQHQTAAATVQQLPGMKLSSPQTNSWQSVADRINDFERQQQHLSIHHYHSVQQQSNTAQKYSYIDPSKMHRVPNPALKAFQKNAVQSYFERQQQNAKDNKTYSSINNLSRPQSLQPANSPKEVPTPHIRTSLPNNYAVPNASPRSPNAPIPTQRSPSAQQIINSSINEYSISSVDTVIYGEINVPPPPPPRSRSLMPIRRSSSASDYADFRESFIRSKEKQASVNEAIIGTVTSPEKSSFNDCGVPPPPPPPRGRANMPVRRTSSASEYAAIRDKNLQMRNLSKDLLGPIIMGPIISVDDWVPERPPKNPHLRIPSPDLPPPPLQIIDTDVNLLNQDEPLPPPPPEILRHIRPSPEVENKPPSPSRRNSFAGSPSRKAFYRTSFENLSSPPSVPKKPPPLEMMQSRPASSLAQSNKAHKVILNGKLECPISSSSNNNGHLMHSSPSQDPFIMPRGNDARISMRKRAHNANPSPQALDITKSPGKLSAHNMKSPPPLKPRMPIAGQEMRATSVAINSKIRCNSKASYLPRQSRDKLNTADPDHGSYKLTLTSNEDSINHNTSTNYHDDILSSKCNNLPDVLPVGAKVQPSSPSSSNSSPRYGSNNNITSPPPPHTAPALLSTSYPIKSLFHFQSPNSPNRQNSSPPANSPSSYNSPNRTSPFVSNDPVSPKFMSQSTIDLKKTHILETSEAMKGKTLSPAQSESNIIQEKPQLSPFSTRREYQRTDVVRKLSLEERESGEGRIVRAELVNTILSTSPTSPRSEEKLITRKDSLRENIEKITQLQSKLMSAHLIDNGSERKLLGYTAKTLEVKTQQKSLVEKELPKQIIEEKPAQHPESPIKLTAEPPSSSPAPSEAEKISQMDSEVDGLKLMQRTEIILRLNAPTSEAASQTDETLETELSRVKLTESRDDHIKSPERVTTSILVSRKKLPEEIDCDNLSKDLASRLPPTDKLCQVLAPKIFKSSSDYVSGLYNPNVAPRPAKRDVATSTPDEKSIGCELAKTPNTPNTNTNVTAAAVESAQSPNTGDSSSAAATTRYNSRDVPLMNGNDTCDLIKKKEELVNRLTKKILTLGNEQSTIAEETSANDQLGSSLAIKISEKVRPIDATKFRAYIDDVGHITMLLLSLSGRLAKVENALNTLNENHAEQKILETKRDRLMEQLEEAKRLKEDIDRRGTIVGKILEKNLTIDEYADYDYFINMKAKLIIDSREIADRMKLSEEQLSALKDTLVQSEC